MNIMSLMHEKSHLQLHTIAASFRYQMQRCLVTCMINLLLPILAHLASIATHLPQR